MSDVYDDDESFDAADHGPLVVDPDEERRLFLEACARAAEAGL